jgi:VWFA-related protein
MRCSVVRGPACVLAVLAWMTVSPAAQVPVAPADAAQAPGQAPGQPTFRTDVDVVLVDVTVLDGQGRPLTTLTPADFEVRVDGKKRTTLSADLVEYTRQAVPDRRAEAAVAAGFSTNEGDVTGRAVLLVLDMMSFPPGDERRAIVAASEFLDSLSPADRVAIGTLPFTDQGVGFTRDIEKVRARISGLIGMRTESVGQTTLGRAEVLRADRGDTTAWRQIIQRECRITSGAPSPFAEGATACDMPGYEPDCPCVVQDRLRQEVRAMVGTIRQDTDRQVRALLDLFDALRAFRGPKVVVVISQGVVFDTLSFPRSALAAYASLADARVSVLHVEASAYDASSNQRPRERLDDLQLVRMGLEDMAALLGGRMYRAMGQVGPQLERIWQDTATSWRLAVEPSPADLDGKPHRLEVVLARKDAVVLTRSHFLVDPSSRQGDSTRRRLRDAVMAAMPATGLPVRVTHYAAPAGPDGTVRVRIVGEVEPGASTAEPPQVVFVVTNEKNKQVAAGSGTPTPVGGGVIGFSTSVNLPPGRYVLRLAATGADGRVGSVERPLEVGPSADRAGVVPALSSDLLIGEQTDGGPTPAVSVRPTVGNGRLGAALEFERTGAAPAVRFEVARSPQDAPVASVEAVVQPVAAGDTDIATATIPVGSLPDGFYVARGVVSSGAARVDTAWRPFRVQAGAVTPRAIAAIPVDAAGATASAASASPVPAAPAPPPLVPGFDRRVVLSGPVLSRTLQALAARPGASANPMAGALAAAKQGGFTAAVESLVGTTDAASAAMLRGMSHLAKARLNDAATAFRESGANAELAPLASVYLGATFAAGGYEADATAAWRAALKGLPDVPALYTMLADSLMRQGQGAEAADVLAVAVTRWPADREAARRHAVALAAGGRWDEAMRDIDGLLAGVPDDARTGCLGFRLAIEAGTAPAVTDEARRRYAATCAAGTAPESPIAAAWLKRGTGVEAP